MYSKRYGNPSTTPMHAKNTYRRGIERLYLSQIDRLINAPAEAKNAKAASIQQVSDVRLFALQHLDMIEAFAKQALAKEPASSINHLHYQEIVKEIEHIKDPKK